MLKEVSEFLKKHLSQFPAEDQLLFNNKVIEIRKDNFTAIFKSLPPASIAFIDGGQAEIISAGNFCLSFIRTGALAYTNNQKSTDYKHEFYLLTIARHENNKIVYQSSIFPSLGEKLIDEQDLVISIDVSLTRQNIQKGLEPASITQVANAARRFAELALAAKIAASADIIVLDGTLDCSYPNEEKYLAKLPAQACALAKSSSLFTVSGNSPVVLLNKLNPFGRWSYPIEGNNYFVKLHEKAKHVFRFTGNKDALPALVENSNDALFLGYPYGLIAVDKFARVSNEEKKALRMKVLLQAENKEIAEYLFATNAHDILDNLN
ncbi:MAG TPA: hypothetical protein VJA18_07245 [Candidatus Nanoarchaeia archaeon]|nr:hypothetical protein [Candidatus Nanoarchaeia archaeon]